jgi:uncharacterized protein YecE (DUF72 family)
MVRFYSKVFDSVQIDSLFNNIPIIFTVKKWLKKKQDNFRFIAKFQKIITHDKRLKNVDNKLELFLRYRTSHEKTLALLIQLPCSLEIQDDYNGLENSYIY